MRRPRGERVNGGRSPAERESARPRRLRPFRTSYVASCGVAKAAAMRAGPRHARRQRPCPRREGRERAHALPAADQLRSTKEAKNEIDLRVPAIEATPPALGRTSSPGGFSLCRSLGEEATQPSPLRAGRRPTVHHHLMNACLSRREAFWMDSNMAIVVGGEGSPPPRPASLSLRSSLAAWFPLPTGSSGEERRRRGGRARAVGADDQLSLQ